jgi:hypothetical protein
VALTPYPVRGKQKSVDLCNAFVAGANRVCKNPESAAVFFGVNESNLETWRDVLRFKRPFYYIDNSFFDPTRGTHFRVTKNKIQISVADHRPDFARWEALGIDLKPWVDQGSDRHVVVCPQSSTFMRDIVRYPGDWLKQTLAGLNEFYPHRRVVVREWTSNKITASRTLPQDLENAVALVTHTSMAAVTALVHGVRVKVSGMHAVSSVLQPHTMAGSGAWEGDRRHVLATLAGAQWTIEELRRGDAWSYLNS